MLQVLFDLPAMTIAVDLGHTALKQTSGFEIAVIECEFLLTHVNKCLGIIRDNFGQCATIFTNSF